MNQKGSAPKDLTDFERPISRRSLVALIADCHIEHAGRTGDNRYLTTESKKSLRNRISHRVRYAEKKRHLIATRTGWFPFGDAAVWMRRTWPNECDGVSLPSNTLKARLTLPMLTIAGTGRALPKTLKACQRALADQYRINSNLRADTVRLNANIGELQIQNALLRDTLDACHQKLRKRSVDGRNAGIKGGHGHAL